MARTLSGSNYLKLVAPPNPQAAGTIYFKFKPTWSSGDAAIRILWEYRLDDDTSLLHLVNSTTLITAGWVIAGVDKRVGASNAGLFTAGAWANWMVTWDNAVPETKFYHELTLVGTSTQAFTPPSFAAGALGIGNVATGAAVGSLTAGGDGAEFALWDRVLDAGESIDLTTNGKGPGCVLDGLLHWVKIIGDSSPEPANVGGNLVLVGTPAQATHPTVDNCPGTDLTIDPETIAETVTVPSPSVDFLPMTIDPLAIAETATIPSPVVTSDPFVIAPTAIAAEVTVPSPAVTFIIPKGLKITTTISLATG